MRPKMLLEIAEGREKLRATAAVEGLSVVQSKVCSKPIASVERFLAAGFRAFEGFYLNGVFD